jgi:SAM-dependent methyltransferase
MTAMNCRHCGTALDLQLVDLGSAPPSNRYLDQKTIHEPESWLPLRVLVCERCWLVQTEDFTRPELLFTSDYAYYSSTSRTWLNHAKHYAVDIIDRLHLTKESFVVEIASNDGYLLKNFVSAKIPCLGIEPAEQAALAAERLGIPMRRDFFGEQCGQRLAAQGLQADLVAANNVYAHVPDINDFTRGIKALLKPRGTVTLEFPHLLKLVEHCQFDTIYHEHFSYLSLRVVQRIFAAAGLRVFDVQLLPTHGGSLRVYGCHQEDSRFEEPSVAHVLRSEAAAGLEAREVYLSFQERTHHIKNDLLLFLLQQKRLGKKLAAYGAAAKGNTLLNFAGVRPDLLPFVCDAAPSKQGKYLPGSRIPIVSPETLKTQRLDYLLILPWNISQEIVEQNKLLEENDTQFVVAVPQLRML